jgi:hypothetical protein
MILAIYASSLYWILTPKTSPESQVAPNAAMRTAPPFTACIDNS